MTVSNIGNRLSIVAGFEYGGTGDYCISTRFNYLPGIVGFYASIDFYPGIYSTLITHLPQILNLGYNRWDKFLSAETRVYSHKQDKITQLQDVLDQLKW